jgi:pilus assembly protein CpaF
MDAAPLFNPGWLPILIPSGLVLYRVTVLSPSFIATTAGGTLISRRLLPLPFDELLSVAEDPSVTDVFCNGPGEVWVDRGAGLVRVPLSMSETRLRELAVRLVSLGGRHIDEASPCVDARLDGGIRVHAVLPPISPLGTLLSIRFPSAVRVPVTDPRLLELVGSRANLLITGAAGSGKTTLLAALLSLAAPTERIVAIEDVAELRVDHPHFVSLEARQANLEGAGEVSLARLLREALRMRPDRLVLGECRGAEVRELLSALNTGHDGGAGTLHANSLADVPARLEALGALAGMSDVAVARQAVSAIGAVVHLVRVSTGLTTEGGSTTERRVQAIGRLTLEGGRLGVEAT